jgi:hypothetical protein
MALAPAHGTIRNDMGAYGGSLSYNHSELEKMIDTVLTVEKLDSSLPKQYMLSQNYPNPFNPITTIEFALPNPEFVTLDVYNILGQHITTLISEKLLPGNYKYVWDASGYSSGVYYYQIVTESYTDTKKLILLR